jgi:two-component system, NarL family, invasion response regulator UvrY
MIRILIVDDHPIVREGIAAVLSRIPDVEIVGEAGDAGEAIEKARTCAPDLVLLDISLPGRSGLEVLDILHVQFPAIKVLMVSTYPEKQYAVRCLKSGASGYLTKKDSTSEMLPAIQTIMKGKKYVTSTIAELLADDLENPRDPFYNSKLSDRELQVLCYIAQGKTINDIANILSLSSSTVHKYRANILDKLNLKTTAQMIRYAIDHHLIDPAE